MKKYDAQSLKDVRAASLEARTVQKSLRILSAVRWEKEFEAKYFAQTKAPTTKSIAFAYGKTELPFDRAEKLEEISRLRERVEALKVPEARSILRAIADDYENIVHLLSSRGTYEFGEYSQKLWGAPEDAIFSDGVTIADFTDRFKKRLDRISDAETEKMFPKVLSAEAMVELLRRKLNEAHLLEQVDVRLSDTLAADAAAGADYLKIRKGAMFSVKDVDVLIFHEAYTHIATALNGRNQRYAKWLAFDSPRCSSTQEGLAVLMEMLSGRTYPRRLRRIVDRILLLSMIRQKNSPKDLYDFLRSDGYTHQDSLTLIMRAYRGSNPEAYSPFTKDVSYIKGLIECFNYIQASLADNRYDDIPAIYAGKLSLKEVPLIVKGFESGLVERPKWIPSAFLDLDSLSGWFTYVSALGNMSDPGIRARFRALRENEST